MAKRKRGRPTIPATPGERTALSLRVSAEVKDKLIAAAVQSGRSLSQEVELRVERSFEQEWIVKRMQEVIVRDFIAKGAKKK